MIHLVQICETGTLLEIGRSPQFDGLDAGSNRGPATTFTELSFDGEAERRQQNEPAVALRHWGQLAPAVLISGYKPKAANQRGGRSQPSLTRSRHSVQWPDRQVQDCKSGI